jgi:hypothetical protein
MYARPLLWLRSGGQDCNYKRFIIVIVSPCLTKLDRYLVTLNPPHNINCARKEWSYLIRTRNKALLRGMICPPLLLKCVGISLGAARIFPKGGNSNFSNGEAAYKFAYKRTLKPFKTVFTDHPTTKVLSLLVPPRYTSCVCVCACVRACVCACRTWIRLEN